MNLEELKKKLKSDFLNKSLPVLLKQIVSDFDKNSERYDDLILIQADHKSLDNNIIRGIIDYNDENIHLAKIRGRLLRFIGNIELSDFNFGEQNLELQIGTKDLPSKVLVVIGKMTPEIAKSRLISHKEILIRQAESIKYAVKLKDNKAGKSFRKITALNNKNSGDFRLYKKYAKEFAKAFKPLTLTFKKLSKEINEISTEFGILGLYQIQTAYSVGKLNRGEILSFLDLIEEMTQEFKELDDLLKKRIEVEKLDLIENEKLTRVYGLKGPMKKSLNAKILLKESFIQFMQECETIKKVVSTTMLK